MPTYKDEKTGLWYCKFVYTDWTGTWQQKKKKADDIKFWTLDEFKVFERAIGNKIITKTIFNLLYWSGMRSDELLALTLRDFDFETRTVTIVKNYARLDKEDLILEPKTPKSNCTIGIPKLVCNMVKDYASKLMDYEANERPFDVTKGFLYPEMERISKESGVKKICIHDIRRSHASLLIDLNTNILLISERFGHEDVETTLEIYGHLYPHKDEEVAGRLEKLCV